MTTAAPLSSPVDSASVGTAPAPDTLWRQARQSGRIVIGGSIFLLVLIPCVVSMFWTLSPESRFFFDGQNFEETRRPPNPGDGLAYAFGTDTIGRSIIGRCLLGGVISLGVGAAAATISVVLGVSVGLFAGYRGGWVDALLMRTVDVMYGLPYILLIVLFKIAFEQPLTRLFHSTQVANLVVLFMAIGLVSWLTMARVVRGQVLSLRSQPFIEACRSAGLPEWRIFTRHLLPNLIGPVIVYATLTVPQAILQESFLSFLGIGIQKPMPTWGSLASEGLLPSLNTVKPEWWMLTFPCVLLAITLLSLNFLGDGLRDVFDPKREAAKI